MIITDQGRHYIEGSINIILDDLVLIADLSLEPQLNGTLRDLPTLLA
jgi:hypothetical protein